GRDQILKNFKRMFSLAAAAQAEGLGKTDKVNREMAFDMDRVFAAEEFRRNPKGTVSKEEIDAYSAAHWDDIKLNLKLISPETRKRSWVVLKRERILPSLLEISPMILTLKIEMEILVG